MDLFDTIAGGLDHAAGSTDEWVGEHWGTSDPTAVVDPDRQFGFDLIDTENPDDAVFGESSRDWAEMNRTIENADDEIAAGLEDVWNQSTPDSLPDDPTDPFTPGWLEWGLNHQEEVAVGLVVLVFLFLARPYASMADSATS